MYFYEQNYSDLVNDFKEFLAEFIEIIDLLIIYGSVSKKRSTVLSDMDVLLVSERHHKRAIKDKLSDFSAETGVLIDLMFIPTDQLSIWKNHPIVRDAYKEGIILWEK